MNGSGSSSATQTDRGILVATGMNGMRDTGDLIEINGDLIVINADLDGDLMDVEDIDIGLIEGGGLNHMDEGPGDHKDTEDGMATEQLQPCNKQ